jgi:RNA 2',3'-cyclic 3'-phosphodiesterase
MESSEAMGASTGVSRARGRTVPRMLLLAMPPPTWVEDTLRRLVQLELPQRLGSRLFAPRNWHQSFSERIYAPTVRDREALLEVGGAISAHACTLHFNRIEGPRAGADRSHCTLRARGVPKAFSSLLRQVQQELVHAGYEAIATGVTPHVTLSYDALDAFETLTLDPPIPWTIDALCLAIGGGESYRYEIIGRWPLLPEVDPPVAQPGLF